MDRMSGPPAADWPKVELHRHLEGTVRLDTAWRWARYSPDLDLKSIDELRSRVQFDGIADFAHFLSKFGTLRELYHDPRAIEQVTREAVADAAADQVRYIEFRFSPDHFSQRAGHDPYEIGERIVTAGMDEAARQGIQVRYLCTLGRGYDEETIRRIMDIALALRDRGVVGIDLAGDEIQHSGRRFVPAIEQAVAAGFGISIHAGEAGPPANVWEAIDLLHADRIGHGIRSIEDPALIQTLIEREIALEVSPTSNLHTGVVSSIDVHPLPALVAAGVPVALSTDDPAISDITLGDEYDLALRMGIDEPTLARMVLDAARHAFLPAPEKAALIADLEQSLARAGFLPVKLGDA